ncbi:MAG: HNH endonuclease [Streptomycetaceae bacterium]|nr:MAG: HNH endonuclease [Streptomycetaceae bacterium]
MTMAALHAKSDTDAAIDLNQEVIELLAAFPGIETLTGLVAIDPANLSRSGRIDYLAALERQSAWLQAVLQRAIVAVAGETPSIAENMWDGIDGAEREDIAAALRLSGNTAQMRIDVARTLVNHLPNTCSALAMGEISSAHATVIAKETAAAIRDGISEFAIYQIEEKALAFAEFHTPGQVANKVRTTIAQLAPLEFEKVVDRARETRRVSCYNEADGMATVVAILPAQDAQTVMKSIEAYILTMNERDEVDRAGSRCWTSGMSSSGMSSSGTNVSVALSSGTGSALSSAATSTWSLLTADNKRADALTAILSSALAENVDEVRPHRRPVTVNVTIDLPTLLGLAENPGQLSGYGAIPASVARELASDATWKRFITDPQTGNLLDYGREKYEPPQALVDFLLARDRTCRFPGCRQPASRTDIDHAESWESGGETTPENLGLLCRRHHRLKTHGKWSLISNADGSCNWTSPVGKNYFVPARPINETA